MELTLGDKLKAIHKDFLFDVNLDVYNNSDFVVNWLENDLFEVGTLVEDKDTGSNDYKLIGTMTESQVLFYLSSYYYRRPI